MDFRKQETLADGPNKQKLQTDNSTPPSVQSDWWYMHKLEVNIFKSPVVITANGDTIYTTEPATHHVFQSSIPGVPAYNNWQPLEENFSVDMPGSQIKSCQMKFFWFMAQPNTATIVDTVMAKDTAAFYLNDTLYKHAKIFLLNDIPVFPPAKFAMDMTAEYSDSVGVIVKREIYVILCSLDEALYPADKYQTTGAAIFRTQLSQNQMDTVAVCLGLGNFGIIDEKLNAIEYGEQITLDRITSVPQNSTDVPSTFSLSQNYPNPFNPETTIPFDIQREGRVTVKIYNSEGKVVKILVDRDMVPGKYEVNFDASELASGTYYAQMNVGGRSNFTETIKITLIK